MTHVTRGPPLGQQSPALSTIFPASFSFLFFRSTTSTNGVEAPVLLELQWMTMSSILAPPARSSGHGQEASCIRNSTNVIRRCNLSRNANRMRVTVLEIPSDCAVNCQTDPTLKIIKPALDRPAQPSLRDRCQRNSIIPNEVVSSLFEK